MQEESAFVSLVGEQKHYIKPLLKKTVVEGKFTREDVGEGDVAEIFSQLKSPTAFGTKQSESFSSLSEKNEKLFVETEDGQCRRFNEIKERQASSHSLQPYALDKAPPPIRTRRDTGLRESAPPDLSPPPSPKRMRELARKEDNHSLAFGNSLPGKLSELKTHLSS